MSDYDFRPGGSLKLKKGVAEGGITKKKKKSKPKGDKDSKQDHVKDDSPVLGSPEGSDRNSPALGSTSSERKTEAERRFQEVQRKRLAERVKKLATKTHKDRVHEFNAKLESLSEHHDIPKVIIPLLVLSTIIAVSMHRPAQRRHIFRAMPRKELPPAEKKGHVCPPSDAKHPRDRWESLFVYSFICKFTQLRSKVEGLESPTDFEEALLSHEPHPVMTQILTRFVLNLRPQARNISERIIARSADQISSTVSAVLADYFKSSERTVFWDDTLKANVDPFQGFGGGFFAAHWDLKVRVPAGHRLACAKRGPRCMQLKVLRQLVELQLTHGSEIKEKIDYAWGVVHNKHKKKEHADPPPLDPSDPFSMENLQFNPIGQDIRRRRYWVVDDSPRVYTSTNPWKVTATIKAVSTTREEYVNLVEELKSASPDEAKEGERRTKMELAHIALLKFLEGRLESIDHEIARVQKARKKIEQRNLLLAQAEIRQTRTRRQTRRPDYVYYGAEDDEDDQDAEDNYQEDDTYEEQLDEGNYSRSDSASGSTSRVPTESARRRSTRTTVINGNGKRAAADSWSGWRGERRSVRLGAPPEVLLDEPHPKRARTEESTISVVSEHLGDGNSPDSNVPRVKHSGAAAVKPTEVVVEQLAGRKKSKFWYYAVEPIPAPAPESPVSSTSNWAAENGQTGSGHADAPDGGSGLRLNGLEGSLSPAPSMDDS
ncbi:hypothetical protein EW146_g6651 [Bondarzewia mesenterica]|uniref:WHIM1 domain-containing protein n=1 Tax=Bondarzewia mesenterica TaxID=1095465 RepID=A0A4S4LN53_9AGAM|nr:hypothetical protein EW146_g6651 [Bondarzewia mesenterica]